MFIFIFLGYVYISILIRGVERPVRSSRRTWFRGGSELEWIRIRVYLNLNIRI
jgi:hypothetical protein